MMSIEMTYQGTPIVVSVNDTFNRLTITKLFKEDYRWYATCVCSCGTTIQRIYVRSLLSGNTKSCGCYNSDLTIQRNLKHGLKTRNAERSRLYSIWTDMRRRCNNPERKRSECYAAKGIKVCEEWNDFAAFKDWSMANGYNDTLSIDRIDNNKGYCPENCRWIPFGDQSKNRTTNHYITFNGKTQTLTDWSKEIGIGRNTLTARLQRGWSIEKALTTPKIEY